MDPSNGMLPQFLLREPQGKARVEKIGDGEIDVIERALMRKQSDDAGAGVAGGLDADGRILENDAVFRLDAEFTSGAEINVGRGLGTLHLGTIDDDTEIRTEAGAVEDEIDIRALGVTGKADGRGRSVLKKAPHAGDELIFQAIAHQLAVQALFGCAVFVYQFLIGSWAEKVQNDLVISASMHAREQVFAGNAEEVQILAPGGAMDGHRVHHDAVHIENEREPGPDRARFSGGRLIQNLHLVES